MRDAIFRLLRSCGLSRGDTPDKRPFVPHGDAQPPAFIDTDCRRLVDGLNGWPDIDDLGGRAVVVNRVPAGEIPLSPENMPASAYRAVIDPPPDPDQRTLQAFHEKGARGVRFHLGDAPGAAAMLGYADHLVLPGWHIELELPANDSQALHRAEWVLTRMPVPLCFTGLAGFLGSKSAKSETELLLDFVHMGRFWLKLIGAELIAAEEASREAALALAHDAMARRPDRLVWGSGLTASAKPAQLASTLQPLLNRFPDAAQQRQILSANPAILYGF